MRSGYVEINNYKKLGDMGISHRVFEHVATIACNQVNGVVSLGNNKKKKNSAIELFRPVHATIKKNGKVEIRLDVILQKGVDVKKVCQSIEDNVTNSLQMMCETVPFSVEINVRGIA